MRIVHLSDFHLDKKNEKKSKQIVTQLIQALSGIHDVRAIDLIVFAGDAINQGGQSYPSTREAFNSFKTLFIDPIIGTLHINKERFIFVPGNHDMQRSEDSPYSEKGLKDMLNSEEDVERFINESRSNYRDIGRVKTFKQFEQEYYSALLNSGCYRCTPFESNIIIQIDGVNVGLNCLNTSWRSWESSTDMHNLLLGIPQFDDSNDFLETCGIKIAIGHHGVNWMKSFEELPVKKRLVQYDLFLSGHTHSASYEYCVRPEGSTMSVVSPGILSSNVNTNNQDYVNGFSIIDYEKNVGSIEITKYHQKDSLLFRIDNNYAENGHWRLNLPIGEEAAKAKELQEVILCIKENAEAVNEHLLSYKTSTNAPKALNEIFVDPILTTVVQEEGDIESGNYVEGDRVSLDQIEKSNNNYLIFGIRESGKTVILDKILLDVLDKGNELPVFVDFDLISRDIETSIREYWKRDKGGASRLISEQKVLLLIDNLSMEEGAKAKKVFDFINNNKNIRFIATVREATSHEFFNDIEIPGIQYERLEIGQMESRQISELAKKWLNKVGGEKNVRLKFEEIIRTFSIYNLPRTPFAISMFLWLLEKNANYNPQNSAVLIESFIEELLKNQTDKKGVRRVFDFENKMRLLAGIAELMLKGDNESYEIRYSEIIKYVEDYLSSKHFERIFSAKDIIKEFVKRGVLVDESNSIRFRFNGFLEFFLAKQMEYDSQFRKAVLTEDKCLLYYDEIICYTGLHRAEEEILDLVMNVMEYQFIDVESLIAECKVNSIDDFFSVNKSVLQAIPPEKLEAVLPEKKTEQDFHDETDYRLKSGDKGQSPDVIRKKKESSRLQKISKSWLLAMNVLKNSEEVTTAGLKIKCYDKVIKYSLEYTVFSKMLFSAFLEAHIGDKDASRSYKMLLRFMPVIMSEILSDNLGTFKLSEVIINKIKQDQLSGSDISELESFLSVFLNADVRGVDFRAHLEKYINGVDKMYIADSCFLKLLTYYYNSDESSYDSFLIKNLARLYVKVNKDARNPKSRISEPKVIQMLINGKKRREIKS